MLAGVIVATNFRNKGREDTSGRPPSVRCLFCYPSSLGMHLSGTVCTSLPLSQVTTKSASLTAPLPRFLIHFVLFVRRRCVLLPSSGGRCSVRGVRHAVRALAGRDGGRATVRESARVALLLFVHMSVDAMVGELFARHSLHLSSESVERNVATKSCNILLLLFSQRETVSKTRPLTTKRCGISVSWTLKMFPGLSDHRI